MVDIKNIAILSFEISDIGGGQKMTLRVADCLSEYFGVNLILFYKIDKNFCLNNNKIKMKNFDIPKNSRAGRVAIMTFLKLKEYINSEKINVLIISGTLPIPVVFLAKIFINKCKIIFWDHECITGRDKKSLFFRKLACIISEKIVTISKRTYNDYISILKCPRKKLLHIYNFASDKFYENTDKYNVDSKLVLSVGRLSPEKGFDLAIDSAKIIFKKHKDWQWHIYGEGSERKFLEKKIQENELERNIILKGECLDIYKKYQNYSIFVMPSYREGFSLVLLEAKISRLPCISFDCAAGPSEIIREGINGFLIECYDISKMAEKIIHLIENRDLRIKFSENCSLDLEKFDRKISLEKWKHLI
ncbi:MAG: glycosyltransferase [Oscillospiraceae bacterium]|jgi:glycosyltransferase involved in cell wall biosynthesis|nr:glycosyltransferase [Oscillospiraceae bacterium]